MSKQENDLEQAFRKALTREGFGVDSIVIIPEEPPKKRPFFWRWFKEKPALLLVFDYECDADRANVVRDSWLARRRGTIVECSMTPSFHEKAEWDHTFYEKMQMADDYQMKQAIQEGVRRASVMVLLIGEETVHCKWVNYALLESYGMGKGIIGVYIHQIKDAEGNTAQQGRNPLEMWRTQSRDLAVLLSRLFPTYDWVEDQGAKHIGSWVKEAVKKSRASK